MQFFFNITYQRLGQIKSCYFPVFLIFQKFHPKLFEKLFLIKPNKYFRKLKRAIEV